MDQSGLSEKIVRCPSCGGPSVYAGSNGFRPFCSERCKLQDLGAWASEAFRVAANPGPSDGAQDDVPLH